MAGREAFCGKGGCWRCGRPVGSSPRPPVGSSRLCCGRPASRPVVCLRSGRLPPVVRLLLGGGRQREGRPFAGREAAGGAVVLLGRPPRPLVRSSRLCCGHSPPFRAFASSWVEVDGGKGGLLREGRLLEVWSSCWVVPPPSRRIAPRRPVGSSRLCCGRPASRSVVCLPSGHPPPPGWRQMAGREAFRGKGGCRGAVVPSAHRRGGRAATRPAPSLTNLCPFFCGSMWVSLDV